MTKIITRKSTVQRHLEPCLNAYKKGGLQTCVQRVKSELLDYKIKFPILEYCGTVLHEALSPDDHLPFCDALQNFKTEGGNVITGIILQKRLREHLRESFGKATTYLEQAHIWYICDIIGERVFGYGLLHYPEQALPELTKLAAHPVNWVKRGMGAGVHYAIKKGLGREFASETFKLLLTMANSKDKEIRQGVGWAAKTTAKFHPDIIEEFTSHIQDETRVENWFRRKIDIGLKRHLHAKGG